MADDPNGDPQATEILRYLAGFGVHADQDMTQQGGPATYHHGDLIRSTMLLTDESGQPCGTGFQPVGYTAFGEMVRPSGTIGYDPNAALPTRYQYAGGWGYESGVISLYGANPNLPPVTLMHVGARWYQPDIGRFVQRDPIGIEGGLNCYAYVKNKPSTAADPLGLHGCDWCGGAIRHESWCPMYVPPRPPQPVPAGDPPFTIGSAGMALTGGEESWLDDPAKVANARWWCLNAAKYAIVAAAEWAVGVAVGIGELIHETNPGKVPNPNLDPSRFR